MKVIVVDPVLSRKGRMDYFHHVMFHGRIAPAKRKGGPAQIVRNGWRIPDVVAPLRLWIVSDEVKRKLEGLSHVVFSETEFGKLIDRPWELGKFGHYVREHFQDPVELLNNSSDVPAMHKGVGKYYIMEVPSVSTLAEHYPPVSPISFDLYDHVSSKVGLFSAPDDPVALSIPLMEENPLVGEGYLFMTEKVFALLRPHLEKDFFAKAELELTR